MEMGMLSGGRLASNRHRRGDANSSSACSRFDRHEAWDRGRHGPMPPARCILGGSFPAGGPKG
jgi:hypothetical protein